MKGAKRWSQPLGVFASCPGDFEDFKKCFIDSSKLNYTNEEIDKFRAENNITIIRNVEEDNTIIKPFLDWKNFPLGPPEFEQPTAIQSEVIPMILTGRNVVAIAQTGSGKTLAYLLPSLIHLEQHAKDLESPNPKMLILAPTRELGVQIYDQLLQLIQFYYGEKKQQSNAKNGPDMLGLKIVCIYGGNPNKKQQVELIHKGVHIIVATPGRLIELIEEGMVSLNKVSMLILDEADRMLDMGFEPQVREIVSTIREDRQTILLSATWPNEVQQLSKEFCQDPILVKIGKAAPITQKILCVSQKEKLTILMNVLDDLIFSDKVLIFAETKKRCEQLSQDLTKQGYFCISLHGDKSQEQRDAIMKQFKDSNTRLICATDIASRGLDVKDITVVINYDFPKSFDDYIHRIGRTGRAGAHGRSFSFLSYEKDEGFLAESLMNYLKAYDQEITTDLMEFQIKSQKIKQERQQKKLQQYVDDHTVTSGVYPPNNFMQTQTQNFGEQKQQNIPRKVLHKHNKSDYNQDNNGKTFDQEQRNYNMNFKQQPQQSQQPQEQQKPYLKSIDHKIPQRKLTADEDQRRNNQDGELKNYKPYQEENQKYYNQQQFKNEGETRNYNMDFRQDNDYQNKRNNNQNNNNNNNNNHNQNNNFHEHQFYNEKYLFQYNSEKQFNNNERFNNEKQNQNTEKYNNTDRYNNNNIGYNNEKQFNNNHERQNNNDRFNNNNVGQNNERFGNQRNQQQFPDKQFQNGGDRNFYDQNSNNNDRNQNKYQKAPQRQDYQQRPQNQRNHQK